jgi:hypothetical protein
MRDVAVAPKKRSSLWSRFADVQTVIGICLLVTLWVVLQ